MKYGNKNTVWLAVGTIFAGFLAFSACQPLPASPAVKTPSLVTSQESEVNCSAVERLPNDSSEAQQIIEELIQNFKKQQPTEYMGMALLERVDRLGEWAVIQGSVSGDDGNILVVRRTSQGYQLAEQYLIIPGPSTEEQEKRITGYFLEKLPDAPAELFTCLEGTWLSRRDSSAEAPPVFQLAYVGTSGGATQGITEIHRLQSDGSSQSVLLSEAMLVLGLASSPDGEQLAFWGCPGSLANDCTRGEDPDVWTVNWDESNQRNLTEASSQSDSHPDWSPDGRQIVFDSDRSGRPQLYIMDADGSNVRALTENEMQNTEPKWSPDGKWIAYHCMQAGKTRICVISPEGEVAGEPISGTMPLWSPGVEQVQLAYICFQDSSSDICTARPDGSNMMNLTNSPADQHSPAWSPDGAWLAFVSNSGEDVDIYKICATCQGEPAPVRLTDETQPSGWPAWSPDGSWVAYVSAETLMMVRADRSGVTFLAGGVYGPPVWRP